MHYILFLHTQKAAGGGKSVVDKQTNCDKINSNAVIKSAKSKRCKAREKGESSPLALFAAAFERPVRAGGSSPIWDGLRYSPFGESKLGWYRENMLSPLNAGDESIFC